MIDKSHAVSDVVALIASSLLVAPDIRNAVSEADRIAEIIGWTVMSREWALDVYSRRLRLLENPISHGDDLWANSPVTYETALERLARLVAALQEFQEEEVLLVHLKSRDLYMYAFFDVGRTRLVGWM